MSRVTLKVPTPIKRWRLIDVFSFLCGFSVGIFMIINFYVNRNYDRIPQFKFNANDHELYNSTLADWLYDEVKILCWVFTVPENHKTKAWTVKNTWGKRCNKLIFMSTEDDPELGAIAMPVEEGRGHLWNKTQNAMKYVYKHHINDADWFMRADDDNFMILENLRYLLYQYRPQTSIYVGHRIATSNPPEGFMTGGGHLFSKMALRKTVEDIFVKADPGVCNMERDGFADDLIIGGCMAKSALFANELDELNQKRFFPAGVGVHYKNQSEVDPNYWYIKGLWYNVSGGSLRCCSDTFAGVHYVTDKQIYALEYFVYNVHPFGYDQNSSEILPRKFTLEEIIARSDAKSTAKEYRVHEIVHNLEESERF